jgi:hypothetical protein
MKFGIAGATLGGIFMYIIGVSNRIDSINKGGTVEPQNTGTSLPEFEPVKPNGFFIRLWGGVFSPSETFREVGLAPRVLIPIIALFLVSSVYFFLMAKHMDVSTLLNAQQMSQANAQSGFNQEKLELVLSIFFAAFLPIFSILMALIMAGIGKLISFFVGAENEFKPLFSVTLYVMIAIAVIQAALLGLLLIIRGPGQVSIQNMGALIASNLGAILGSLFGEDFLSKFWMRLLQSVDAFTILYIALLSIGYSAVSRKLKTKTVAIWFAVLVVVMALLSASLSSMFSPS